MATSYENELEIFVSYKCHLLQGLLLLMYKFYIVDYLIIKNCLVVLVVISVLVVC